MRDTGYRKRFLYFLVTLAETKTQKSKIHLCLVDASTVLYVRGENCCNPSMLKLFPSPEKHVTQDHY